MRKYLALFLLLIPSALFGQAQGSFFSGTVQTQSGLRGGATVTVCSTAVIANSPTGATESGNTVTITTNSPHGFVAGQVVQVTGISQVLYNGTFTILTVPTNSTFTYTNSNAGLSASGQGAVLPTNVPCTPTASIFSDIGLTAAKTNPTTTDGLGNFSFYAAAGLYTYTVTGAGIPVSTGGPFTFQLPCIAGQSCVATSANNAFTGINTFSNEMLSATIASNDGVTPNLVTFDYRGTTIPSNTAPNKTVAYNVTTGGNTDAMERSQMTTTSVPAAGSTVNKYIINSCNNCANPNVIDGASTEGQTTGTLTGTLGVGSGNESPFSILSTGGTAAIATGGNDYVFVGSQGSPTAVTNAYGRWLRGCQGTPGSVANCYGGFSARQQGFGTVRNYAHGFEGVALFLFDANVNKGGYDAEDAAHVTHPTFYIDGSSNTNYQAINTNGLFLCSSDSACRVRVTAAGLGTITGLFPTVAANHPVGTNLLPYSGLFYGAAATNNAQLTGTFTAARTHTGPDASGTLLISGNGDGTHAIKNQSVRFSGVLGGTCPTAAAIGAACTSGNINWTTSFGDNSYAVTCTLNGALTGQPHVVGTTYQAGGVGITITIAADTAAAANVGAAGFTHCTAFHD